MLAFSKLSSKDKTKRYRWLIELPFLALLLILTFMEVNYVIICVVYSSAMISSLVFYGLLSKKNKYSSTSLVVDSAILYALTVIQTLLITPILKDYIDLSFESSYYSNIYTVFLSIGMIYVYWYLILKVQQYLSKNKYNWKWKVSGLFNSSFSFRRQEI